MTFNISTLNISLETLPLNRVLPLVKLVSSHVTNLTLIPFVGDATLRSMKNKKRLIKKKIYKYMIQPNLK